jgi:FG-GAP-like repeat
MLHRILTLLFVLGTTVSLMAQSNLSFETYMDPQQAIAESGGYLVAGDFNNDGKPDLIECCNSSNQMVFRAGNGDGTFQAPVVAWSTPVALGSLAAVDVNGDGKLDLVAIAAQNPPSNGGTGTYYLTVWLGNGNGTFQDPQTYSTANFPLHAFTGNFLGDGHTDLAVLDDEATFSLFRNQGNGTFVLDKTIETGGLPAQGVAGDFNGSGATDLAMLQQTSADNGAAPWDLVVFWNDGKGDFTQQNLGGNYPAPPGIAVGRLNGDAATDILVSYACTPASGDKYCVGFDGYYGQGNNTLYKRTLVTDSSGVNFGTLGQVAAVDLNGDGIIDIAAVGALQCNATTGACPASSPYGLFAWLGNADGSFQQTPEQFFVSSGYTPGAVAMADFNRDGMMDFAQGMVNETEIYLNATPRASCGTYTISPTVTVCQPVDNTYSTSPVDVDANSYDTTPVTAMQEYIDGTLEYSKAVKSFNTTFPVDDGTHLFVTKAWDSSGRSFVADRTVTAYSGTPGPVCPTAMNSASICLPSGDTSSSPVLILANGDTSTPIATAAQLYIDGTLTVDNKANCNSDGDCYGVDTFVQASENLAPGSHDLVFKLWSLDGTVYTAQKTITVN